VSFVATVVGGGLGYLAGSAGLAGLTAGSGLLAGAGLGASIGGSINQANAISDAAAQSAAATGDANALQKYMYDTTRSDTTPWRQAGQTSLTNLMNILNGAGKYSTAQFTPGDLTQEPGYQFQLQQGQRGLNNMADTYGVGGASLKAASRFNQGLADTTYQNAFNRFQTERTNTLNPLFQSAGLGTTGNQQSMQAGQQYANQAGANLINNAQNQGTAGYLQSNIYGNGINNALAQFGRLYQPSLTDTFPSTNYGDFIGTGAFTGSPFSDRRLKKNIVQVGRTVAGNNVYRWDWIDGSGSAEGVIAQEVAHIPGAVKMAENGYLMVDYSKV
jgi:hypothetical protein